MHNLEFALSENFIFGIFGTKVSHISSVVTVILIFLFEALKILTGEFPPPLWKWNEAILKLLNLDHERIRTKLGTRFP